MSNQKGAFGKPKIFRTEEEIRLHKVRNTMIKDITEGGFIDNIRNFLKGGIMNVFKRK